MMRHRKNDAVTVLRYQLRLDTKTGYAFYHRAPSGQFHPLYSRRAEPRYPPIERCEDQEFIAQFNYKIIVENIPSLDDVGPNLYVRRYHGGNLWPREHIMNTAFSLTDDISDADVKLLRCIESEYREAGARTT
jgi:hypothetical protein